MKPFCLHNLKELTVNSHIKSRRQAITGYTEKQIAIRIYSSQWLGDYDHPISTQITPNPNYLEMATRKSYISSYNQVHL